MSPWRRAVIVVPCALTLVACSADAPEQETDEAPIVQLAAPGESNRPLTPQEASELEVPSVTAADVAFVHGMIAHHEQALEMTAMVPTRAARDDLPLLAERLEISQRNEIAQMEDWLEERGQLGTAHTDHDHGELMPGMLTAEQLSRLSESEGDEFDRLFLEFMIYHHEGAIVMVEDLLTSSDGGQEPQVFALAQHIDADQRVEISRMTRLLAQM